MNNQDAMTLHPTARHHSGPSHCPNCGHDLRVQLGPGLFPSVAPPPTIEAQARLALHMQAMRAHPLPTTEKEVQPAPREGEKLLCRNKLGFVYTDGRGNTRLERIEDVGRDPRRLRDAI